MKIFLLILTSLILIVLGYFVFLAARSHAGSPAGLQDGRLTLCPDSPNCICTEHPDDATHYQAPIELTTVADRSLLSAISQAIENTGGKINQQEDDYLAATYTSSLFHFVDDFELRIDRQNQQLHIRSASRVGHSDFGANLKRVEQFKQALTRALNP